MARIEQELEFYLMAIFQDKNSISDECNNFITIVSYSDFKILLITFFSNTQINRFIYTVCQGPLKIWTEHFTLSHFMKSQLRGDPRYFLKVL